MDLVHKLYKNQNASYLSRKFFQPLTYSFMGLVSKIALLRHHLNIIGSERLQLAIDKRPSNQPLITVSNHHSCLDDFFLCGLLLKPKHFTNVTMCRWCLTAVDICYTTWFRSNFFFWFRGVPVWRRVRDPLSGKITHFGGGVYQPSMDFCIDLLNSGQWVHIFSQGRIIQPHERGSERNIRLRWGIGRLIAESKEDPLIIPIWHCGLDELNPSEVPDTSVTLSRIFGRPRQLTVAVGKPIDTHDLRQKLKSKSSEYFASLEFRSQIHSLFTQIIQEQLYKLKDETELIHRKLTLI
uniref:Tafazzin family protein n=2 Tax=Schistosoma japonicum TaxID=6182 RepID=C1LFL2_SCHJA|nr:tafazzin [Schistosoma japonicum]